MLLSPLLLGCVIFYTAPFVTVIRLAFQTGGGFGLGNFTVLLQNNTFTLAFGNSMKFFAAGLPLILLLAYGIALLLKTQARRHKLLKSVFLLPYSMPVVGTVLLMELFMGESNSSFWITVALYLWKNTGYTVILLLAGLVIIPEEQYESAGLDGATAWQKFRFITTPQMWMPLFFAVTFSVINGFKCFREIFLVGGEAPENDIYMLQHFINHSFENLNYQKLSVSSLLLLLVILLFFGAFYTFVRRKEC